MVQSSSHISKTCPTQIFPSYLRLQTSLFPYQSPDFKSHLSFQNRFQQQVSLLHCHFPLVYCYLRRCWIYLAFDFFVTCNGIEPFHGLITMFCCQPQPLYCCIIRPSQVHIEYLVYLMQRNHTHLKLNFSLLYGVVCVSSLSSRLCYLKDLFHGHSRRNDTK